MVLIAQYFVSCKKRFFSKKRNIKYFFLLSLFFCVFFLQKVSFADEASVYTKMRCNINDECRIGFVCVGGQADATRVAELNGQYSSEPTGCCEPMLLFRQVCLFHNLLTGPVGYVITALVVISVGGSFLMSKINSQKLITFFVGICCIYGSYQVVALITGYDYMLCELVDTSDVPGEGCNVSYAS